MILCQKLATSRRSSRVAFTRHLCAFIILLSSFFVFTGTSRAVAIPSKVQRMTCENWISNSSVFEWANATTYKCIFDNVTQAGNAILIGIMVPTSGNSSGAGACAPCTITPSDDKSNTYNSILAIKAGSLEQVQFFIAQNIAAGTQVVTLSFNWTLSSSGDAAHWMSVSNGEWRNLPTTFTGLVDGSASATGTGTACAPGSFTPATSGDLVIMGCANDNHDSFTAVPNATPLTLFTAANLDESFTVQAGVQSAAGAINPQLNISDCGTIGGSCATEPWVAYGFALKASASNQGSAPPAGIYAEHGLVIPVNGQFTTKTEPIQFPADGNLIVIRYNAQAGTDICVSSSSPTGCAAAQTDSKGNAYSCDPLEVGTGGSGDEVICWAANATTDSTLKITISFNVLGPTVATVYIDSVEGAATSPSCGFNAAQQATASVASASWSGTATITPCAANGIVFGMTGLQSNNGLTATPGHISEPDQNNIPFIWYNGVSTSAQTFSYTANVAPGADVEVLHAFKAPTGGGGGGSVGACLSPLGVCFWPEFSPII